MNIPTGIMLKGVYRRVLSHKHRRLVVVKGRIIIECGLTLDSMIRASRMLESIQNICEETGTRRRRIFW